MVLPFMRCLLGLYMSEVSVGVDGISRADWHLSSFDLFLSLSWVSTQHGGLHRLFQSTWFSRQMKQEKLLP